jgi:UDP-N-acetyl-D-mannosaminuronate dehydrogenase
VKETAFSGVFPVLASLEARGAVVSVHDPMYSDVELAALGLTAYRLGDPVDAAILHTDHAEYRTLTPADLPGVLTFLDGRRLTDSADWPGVTHLVIGRG